MSFPRTFIALIRAERDRTGLSWNEIGRATGLGMREIQSTSKAKRGFSRRVIAVLGTSSEVASSSRGSLNPRCTGIASSRSSRPARPRRTTSSIDGNHNFLANDFVVHNSHAASFALIAYATCWMRKHYLPEFTARC